jgi:hypothetical protein
MWKVFAAVAGLLVWFALAVAPTVGVIWLAIHFARKFW